jgi:hypothetical protein
MHAQANLMPFFGMFYCFVEYDTHFLRNIHRSSLRVKKLLVAFTKKK